jgi:hypothetical protein
MAKRAVTYAAFFVGVVGIAILGWQLWRAYEDRGLYAPAQQAIHDALDAYKQEYVPGDFVAMARAEEDLREAMARVHWPSPCEPLEAQFDRDQARYVQILTHLAVPQPGDDPAELIPVAKDLARTTNDEFRALVGCVAGS